MIIACTGHRPERLSKFIQNENKFRQEIRNLLETYHCTILYSGMAQGVDQIFAQEAQRLDIPVICCFPYRRNNFHPDELSIMDKAADVRYISEQYSKSCFAKRDIYMVDHCTRLLAVWDGIKSGGTWLTIDYAMRTGKDISFVLGNDQYGEEYL